MSYNQTFAYVSHAEGKEIRVLRLDGASGEVSSIQTLAVPGIAMPMAVSPDRRFLYVALRTEPYSVASFAIDALSGELIYLASAPMPSSTVNLSTDRTGRFLFGCSIWVSPTEGHQSTISVSAIGPHGFVQPPHQVIRSEPKTHSIQPDPSNRYIISTGCNGDLVLRHTFDAAAGILSYNALPPVRVKPGAGPRHFTFHPNNRFLYLLNETDATVYTFAYDVNSGSLSELQTVSAIPSDFVPGSDHGGFAKKSSFHAADIHITPDGRFLYASVRTSQTLAAFKVDPSTGMLAPAGHFPTEKRPRGFNIDPYGRHLLAVGELSHGMTAYAVNPKSGSLTALKSYPMGKGPNWVEILRLP